MTEPGLPLPYPAEPPRARTDLPSAGRGGRPSVAQRAVAFLIDQFLVSLLFAVVVVASGVVSLSTATGGSTARSSGAAGPDIPLWSLAAFYSGLAVYNFVGVAVWGRTAGKALLGIRVHRFVGGGRPSPSQAALRAVVPLVPLFVALPLANDNLTALLQFVWMGIYLSAVFEPVGRGVHDRAAGTIVLRSR